MWFEGHLSLDRTSLSSNIALSCPWGARVARVAGEARARGAGAGAISWRAARAAAARAARTPPAAPGCSASCSTAPPTRSASPPAARLRITNKMLLKTVCYTSATQKTDVTVYCAECSKWGFQKVDSRKGEFKVWQRTCYSSWYGSL